METPDEAKKGRPACEPQVRALLRRVLGQEEGREKETEEQPEEEAEIGAGEEPGFREDLQGAGLDRLYRAAHRIGGLVSHRNTGGEAGDPVRPQYRRYLQAGGGDLGKEGGEWKERIATRRIPIGGKPC